MYGLVFSEECYYCQTADKSMRFAELVLLSQVFSFVGVVPGLFPVIMSELKGFTLMLRVELLVRDQTLVDRKSVV